MSTRYVPDLESVGNHALRLKPSVARSVGTKSLLRWIGLFALGTLCFLYLHHFLFESTRTSDERLRLHEETLSEHWEMLLPNPSAIVPTTAQPKQQMATLPTFSVPSAPLRDTHHLPIKKGSTAVLFVGEIRGLPDEQVSVQLANFIHTWSAGQTDAITHSYFHLTPDKDNTFTVGELQRAFDRLQPFHVQLATEASLHLLHLFALMA